MHSTFAPMPKSIPLTQPHINVSKTLRKMRCKLNENIGVNPYMNACSVYSYDVNVPTGARIVYINIMLLYTYTLRINQIYIRRNGIFICSASYKNIATKRRDFFCRLQCYFTITFSAVQSQYYFFY